MIRLDRLRAALATMRYRAAWTLPPRLGRSLARSLGQLRPVISPVGIVLHPYAPPIGGRAFGRYLDGLKRMSRGEYVPLVAHLSLTDRCNNSCRRCSNLAGAPGDPTLDQIENLIEQLCRAGAVSIALTGGEPMLRPDLSEIIAACAPDISTILFTAGEGIDETRAKDLRAAGLDMTFVSLDHFLAAPHDRRRGASGSHAQAAQAIRACRAAGLYTVAQAVAGDDLSNPEEIDRFLAFCRELGAHETMLLEPVGVRPDHACAPISQALRDRLIRLHRQSARDGRMLKVSSASFLESPDFLGCQAGYSFIYISAAGELFPCDFAPVSLGNVYREDVAEILARAKKHFPSPSCRCLALELNELCGPEIPRPIRGEKGESILMNRRRAPLPKLMSWLGDIES